MDRDCGRESLSANEIYYLFLLISGEERGRGSLCPLNASLLHYWKDCHRQTERRNENGGMSMVLKEELREKREHDKK